MSLVARLSQPAVVCYGQFTTGARETMPITVAGKLPPGWGTTNTTIRVTAGTYLYELLADWAPDAEWGTGTTTEIVAQFGRRLIIKCAEGQDVGFRTLPPGAGAKAGFSLTPL